MALGGKALTLALELADALAAGKRGVPKSVFKQSQKTGRKVLDKDAIASALRLPGSQGVEYHGAMGIDEFGQPVVDQVFTQFKPHSVQTDPLYDLGVARSVPGEYMLSYHNHPSGVAIPSGGIGAHGGDLLTYENAGNIRRGTGRKDLGDFIFAGHPQNEDEFRLSRTLFNKAENDRTARPTGKMTIQNEQEVDPAYIQLVKDLGVYDTMPLALNTTANIKTKAVPETATVPFSRESGKQNLPNSVQLGALERLYKKTNKTGLALQDNKGNVRFIPMAQKEMAKLRTGKKGGLGKVADEYFKGRKSGSLGPSRIIPVLDSTKPDYDLAVQNMQAYSKYGTNATRFALDAGAGGAVDLTSEAQQRGLRELTNFKSMLPLGLTIPAALSLAEKEGEV